LQLTLFPFCRQVKRNHQAGKNRKMVDFDLIGPNLHITSNFWKLFLKLLVNDRLNIWSAKNKEVLL
jgi:hypothetical protein